MAKFDFIIQLSCYRELFTDYNDPSTFRRNFCNTIIKSVNMKNSLKIRSVENGGCRNYLKPDYSIFPIVLFVFEAVNRSIVIPVLHRATAYLIHIHGRCLLKSPNVFPINFILRSSENFLWNFWWFLLEQFTSDASGFITFVIYVSFESWVYLQNKIVNIFGWNNTSYLQLQFDFNSENFWIKWYPV